MSWHPRGSVGKGGSRCPPINRNVPGLPNSSIDGLPLAGVAVFGDEQEKVHDFCEQLHQALSQYPVGHCKFENIDVSKVQWNSFDFSTLLDILQERSACTRRLKAYKCGLDDDCMRHLSTWLKSLPVESLPSEIHLSHNAITEDGLSALLEQIELSRSLLTEKVPPIWLRVEENQVPREAIEQLVAIGRVSFAAGVGSRFNCEALVAMPSLVGGAHRNPPGAAGGVAVWAPSGGKAERGKGAGPSGKGIVPSGTAPLSLPSSKGGNISARSSQRPAWGATSCAASSRRSEPWSAFPAANAAAKTLPAKPKASPHLAGAGKGFGKQGKAIQTPVEDDALLDLQLERELEMELQQRHRQESQQRAGERPTVQRARAAVASANAAASDRSRTPTIRKKAANSQEEEDDDLPDPWEKQWSDEYNIPYFWNRETGESSWEKPVA